MNQLKLGTQVFSIHHNDGKAEPDDYWLEYEGVVDRVSVDPRKVVEWRKPQDKGLLGSAVYDFSAMRMLLPNLSGFCFKMAELENMEQYRDNEFYKVPTDILIDHMKSYRSPWDIQ